MCIRDRARSAVRSFLKDGNPEVRLAAIQSAALWLDADAVEPLIRLLDTGDTRECRLAAMALGRIGHHRAVKPLLKAGLAPADPFLKHAITYALYEIGNENLPVDHPMSKQVGLMRKVDEQSPSKYVLSLIHISEPTRPY